MLVKHKELALIQTQLSEIKGFFDIEKPDQTLLCRALSSINL